MTLRRLDKAFAAFFRRIRAGQTPGFPRFKSLVCFSGFNFKSHGDGWRFTPEDGWTQVSLRLSGVGQIRARGQARQGGEIRASEVLHRDGRWYLSLTVAVPSPERTRQADGALTYDWAVERFLSGVTHTGSWRTSTTRAGGSRSKKRSCTCSRPFRARATGATAKVGRAPLGSGPRQGGTQAPGLGAPANGCAGGPLCPGGDGRTFAQDMTRSASGTVEEAGKKVTQKAGLSREILTPLLGCSLRSFATKCWKLVANGWTLQPANSNPASSAPAAGMWSKKQLS